MRTFSSKHEIISIGAENKMVTIMDVAKKAGVSRATVGRVIGNYGSVSEKSREKVMNAVNELGYLPNAIAQGLRSDNTKTIAVVLASIKNNFCNELIYAIEKEAMEYGYNVLICNTHENLEKESLQLQSVYSKQVDGIIMISVCTADQSIPKQLRHLYEGQKIPIVYVDRKIKGLQAELIQSNNKQVSYEITDYLISMGHKKIGVIGTKDYSTVRDRIQGYKDALNHAGIAVDESLIVDSHDLQNGAGGLMTARLLDTHKDLTALYVLNNTLLSDTLLELKHRGLSIPDDISLITWDDEGFNELLDITSVVQPVEGIGRCAVKRLMEKIEHPNRKEEYCLHQLEARVIYRKSCRHL